MNDRETRLSIRNSETDMLIVVVEPWAEEYQVSQGTTIQLRFRGPDEGFPELEHSRKRLTVYGWPGSTFSVFCENVEISRGAGSISAPPTRTGE
jgi:hypothetical protein